MTSKAWAKTDLLSACPIEELTGAHRRDVVYDGVYSTTSDALWLEKGVVDAGIARGHGQAPKWLRHRFDNADFSWIESADMRRQMLPALATIQAWRSMPNDCLASFTGLPQYRASRGPRASQMWANALVDIGSPVTSTGARFDDRLGVIYRPAARSTAFQDHVEEELTFPELVAVTGGREWTGAVHQTTRHNHLASSVSLDVAEYVPGISTVLGDALNDINSLAFLSRGLEATGSNLQPDAVWVRHDGLRICVELTTSPSAAAKKAERWGRLMSTESLEFSGIIVLFLCVERRYDLIGRKSHVAVETEVRKAVSRAIRHRPWDAGFISGSPDTGRLRERVAFASWGTWFPGHGMVSEDFLSLVVERLTGAGASPWESFSLLSRSDLPFHPVAGFDPLAVINNSAALLSVPFWMRDPTEASPPPLWRLPLESLLAGAEPPVRIDADHGGRAPNGRAVPGAGVPHRLRALGGI